MPFSDFQISNFKFLCPLIISAALLPFSCHGADSNYTLDDPRLEIHRLLSLPEQSLVQLVCDARGRLWIGGVNAIYRLDPTPPGQAPRLEKIYSLAGDHWFSGLAVRGDDLIVAKVDEVFTLPGALAGKTELKAVPLVWGFPHAKGYGYHQTLHDLRLGPDGRVYFAMGDPGWFYGDFANNPDHWEHYRLSTAAHPEPMPFNCQGAIFRCGPDGSGLEIVATGLRNETALCFSAAWDLFSNDNDHESDARFLPSRLLQIVDHGFYNWCRSWLDPRPDALPAASIGRDAPMGMAYYDDRYLPADYRGCLLLCRWAQGRIGRFSLEPSGSSFRLTEHPLLTGRNSARPIAVTVGQGGRLFVIISYVEGDPESPHYLADLCEIVRKGDAAGPAFQAYDPVRAPAARLWEELHSPDWSRQEIAYQEIIRRGPPLLDAAAPELARAKLADPDYPHLLRLTAAARTASSRKAMIQALNADSEITQRNALEGVTDHWEWIPPRKVRLLLSQPSTRVRRAAIRALFHPALPLPVADVVKFAAATDQPYLRQTAARLLAERAAPADLRRLLDSSDPAVRLAGVLACGFRLTLPPAQGELPAALALGHAPSSELVPAGGRPLMGLFTMADAWHAEKDHGPREEIFSWLLDRASDSDPVVQLQAIRFVYLLQDRRLVPVLEGIVRSSFSASEGGRSARGNLEQILPMLAHLGGDAEFPILYEAVGKTRGAAHLAAARALVSVNVPATARPPKLPGLLARFARDPHLEEAVRINAVARLERPDILGELALAADLPGPVRARALERLSELRANGLAELLARLEGSAERSVWMAAAKAAEGLAPAAGMRLLSQWLQFGARDARLAAAAALGQARRGGSVEQLAERLPAEADPAVLSQMAASLVQLKGRPAADALAAAVRRGQQFEPAVRGRVQDFLQRTLGKDAPRAAAREPGLELPTAFSKIEWTAAWKAGDPARGRTLFTDRKGGLGCIQCHAWQGGGGRIGPNLDGAGRRLSIPYIVESVLLPAKQVSPQYRLLVVALHSGQVLTGVPVQEDSTSISLGQADGTVVRVPKEQIAEQNRPAGSIMPQDLIKKPEDLRDLLAYLIRASSARAVPGRIWADDYEGQNGTAAVPGHAVALSSSGSWLDYTVQIPAAGRYTIEAQVAAQYGEGEFHLALDGRELPGAKVEVPNTGQYERWRSVTGQIALPAGLHTLRLIVTRPGWRLKSIAIESLAPEGRAVNSHGRQPVGAGPPHPSEP